MATSDLVDLSHVVEEGLITYKGLPAPIICDYWSREESSKFYDGQAEFQIGKIEMVANTGTYLDSPFHRFADGHDLSELKLEQLAGLEGVLVRIPSGHGRAIDETCFAGLDVRGKAVLVHTGWARHWKTDQYFEGHSFLTEGAARALKEAGAVIVGVDTYNIDDADDKRRPVHTTLLGADIPIVEHMCDMERIPNGRPFKFFAVPVRVKGLGSFPVRAFAMLG
jgi:kynurenine formamidase